MTYRELPQPRSLNTRLLESGRIPMPNALRMLSLALFLLVAAVGCSEKRSVAPETSAEAGETVSPTPPPADEASAEN